MRHVNLLQLSFFTLEQELTRAFIKLTLVAVCMDIWYDLSTFVSYFLTAFLFARELEEIWFCALLLATVYKLLKMCS